MESERNAILFGELMLWQPVEKQGPRVSLDTILLAHFVSLRGNEKVLELGSAHGAISLILAKRVLRGKKPSSSFSIAGLEIQPELTEMANRNAVENGLSSCVSFKTGDLRRVREFYPPQSFDVVVMNPPYDEREASRESGSPSLATAMQGTAFCLRDLLESARFLLKNKGRLYVVLRSKRMASLLALLPDFAMEAKRLKCVHPKPDRTASVVLVMAMRAAAAGIVVDPPLFVYGEDGRYTRELLSAYWVEGPRCP